MIDPCARRCPVCHHSVEASRTAPEGAAVERYCIGCLRQRAMATAFDWCVCLTCGEDRPLGLVRDDPEAGGLYWTERKRLGRRA